jgi:dCMP deaminase
MIIGVTGAYAAGKDTVAQFLEDMNFRHTSFSDIIRDELRRRKKKPTRDMMIAVGNELRQRFGANVLAARALEKVEDGENQVFTSIRNPAEVELLQQRDDFVLVHIVASEKIRLQRLIERHREGDPFTMEELRKKEAKENTRNPNAQQLHAVAKKARITLVNESSLESLQKKTGKLVTDWLFKLQGSRPDWDRYFMNIAEQVKTRATCMSAKKGSIIVNDKMIISSGYNGSPKGITHCTSGGCERCTDRHLGRIKSGVYSKPCICCHSEENAIVQAAYNGTSTAGTTLYTTFTPCTSCAKMIINAGVRRVVAKKIYPDDVGTTLLKKAGVEFTVLT